METSQKSKRGKMFLRHSRILQKICERLFHYRFPFD
ncbi:hypothetical protein MTR67_006849 [Solanum verrucosum]|uniref:Uncharacterized protein n=1 Tax=Solanum verrucosum TaxID=315347 RepID=A0AAF0TCJ7_SOLVR|nr:hypothetical protein MTR67_006849 [Solanum verrucosum]